jgi:hypothetical protein
MAKTARAASMWSKSREKKAAKKYHTRNFGTGHVEADSHYLSRVGLRGRKRWLLLSALVFGYLLVLGHLALTCVILGVLNFNAHGPPYFVFNRDGSLRWPQGAVISEVWLEGSLQAFSNQSLAIVGDNDQQVIFKSGSQRFSPAGDNFVDSSQVSFSPSEARLSPFKSFSVSHSNRQLLFANSSLVTMNSLSSLHQLTTTTGFITDTVRALVDGDLRVGSEAGSLSLRGGNGVSLSGDHVNINSSRNLQLTALTVKFMWRAKQTHLLITQL